MQLIPNHHSNRELKNCVTIVTEMLIKDHSKTTQKFWGSSLFQNVGTHIPIRMVSCPVPPTSWIVLSVTTSNLTEWKLLCAITTRFGHIFLLFPCICICVTSCAALLISHYCSFLYSHTVNSCIFASVSFASISFFFFCKCWPICDSMCWHQFVTNKFQEADKGPSIKFISKKYWQHKYYHNHPVI